MFPIVYHHLSRQDVLQLGCGQQREGAAQQTEAHVTGHRWESSRRAEHNDIINRTNRRKKKSRGVLSPPQPSVTKAKQRSEH